MFEEILEKQGGKEEVFKQVEVAEGEDPEGILRRILTCI